MRVIKVSEEDARMIKEIAAKREGIRLLLKTLIEETGVVQAEINRLVWSKDWRKKYNLPEEDFQKYVVKYDHAIDSFVVEEKPSYKR